MKTFLVLAALGGVLYVLMHRQGIGTTTTSDPAPRPKPLASSALAASLRYSGGLAAIKGGAATRLRVLL